MSGRLEELFKERGASEEFRSRDRAYAMTELSYLGRPLPKNLNTFSPKPLLIDSGAEEPEAPPDVNWSNQLVNHWMSTFSRMPRVWAVPWSGEPAAVHQAKMNSALIRQVFQNSRLKSQQPKQAFHFSCRGDAVYGVEWDDDGIHVRGLDPAWCYPSFSDLDEGGMEDLLITYTVDRSWVRRQLGIDLGKGKEKARIYIFWDKKERVMEVNRESVSEHTFTHELGFVPFRWAFSRPNGHMAQSDISEVMGLNRGFTEIMELLKDSVKRNVYKAYWGKGIRENVIPKPDEVIAFTNTDAEIHEFPSATPPEMLLGVLGQYQKYIQGAAGISPISMEGQAHGSIVTGAAVRHQVEAIEARAETKRVVLEAAIAGVAEMVLMVFEKKFRDRPLKLVVGKEQVEITADGISGWYRCEAQYGEFYGLDAGTKVNLALTGQGRLWDDLESIRKSSTEEVDPDDMVQRIADFQIRQAETTAQAQAAAQKVMQEGQPHSAGADPAGGGASGGGLAPSPPQVPQSPIPPTAGQFMMKLGDIENALKVVARGLKGKVWAVGELAVVGMSSQPVLMVDDPDDAPKVMSVLKGQVISGEPLKGAPSLRLA